MIGWNYHCTGANWQKHNTSCWCEGQHLTQVTVLQIALCYRSRAFSSVLSPSVRTKCPVPVQVVGIIVYCSSLHLSYPVIFHRLKQFRLEVSKTGVRDFRFEILSRDGPCGRPQARTRPSVMLFFKLHYWRTTTKCHWSLSTSSGLETSAV